MTDKSIKELALSVDRPVEKLLEQVRDAGLPQRKAEDIISTEQQNTLVNHLKKVHGQDDGNAGKITLKRKTTSTAKVASTSGKPKTINVEVRKKHTFAKPDPEQIKAEALAKAEQYQSKMAKIAKKSYWKPQYHISAPANWINDPNGFCYFNGEYHVFYQYHPYSSQWGPMHWGHVASKDLVNWKTKPIALAPTDEYDRDGCFSGSAIEKDNTLYLLIKSSK